MDEKDKATLKLYLANLLSEKWDEISDLSNATLSGFNTPFLMAEGAATVLFAVADLQEYMETEDMLREPVR